MTSGDACETQDIGARRYNPGSRSVLSRCDVRRFPDQTLFHRIGRLLCDANCLPRKELYESWELARRARRRFRGGRVVDLCAGHGLTAWIMLILDPTSPEACIVDTRIPPSAARIAAELGRAFPAVAARIRVEQADLGAFPLYETDVVVAAHACGALTDRILDRAVAARARVGVLPCCQDARTCDTGGLQGWLDVPLAIDVTRAARLRHAGYAIHTQRIPAAITPKNRLLLAEPQGGAASETTRA